MLHRTPQRLFDQSLLSYFGYKSSALATELSSSKAIAGMELSLSSWSIASFIHTQFCWIKGCGGAGCPPPIIFERLKLPQQIIYRWKGNLSESPNHLKYWENILISRFYKHFSRNSRNLGHFWKLEKFSTLRIWTYHISFWSTWSGDSKYIICFAKYLDFAKIKAIMYFAKFLNAFVKPRNFSRNKLYIWNLQITRFKMIYDMFVF